MKVIQTWCSQCMLNSIKTVHQCHRKRSTQKRNPQSTTRSLPSSVAFLQLGSQIPCFLLEPQKTQNSSTFPILMTHRLRCQDATQELVLAQYAFHFFLPETSNKARSCGNLQEVDFCVCFNRNWQKCFNPERLSRKAKWAYQTKAIRLFLFCCRCTYLSSACCITFLKRHTMTIQREGSIEQRVFLQMDFRMLQQMRRNTPVLSWTIFGPLGINWIQRYCPDLKRKKKPSLYFHCEIEFCKKVPSHWRHHTRW